MNNKLTKDSSLVSVTKPIEGLVITGTLTDEAGNVNKCTITVNVDNVKPTLTIEKTTSIQDVVNNPARDYFTQWFSISKEESIVCKLMDPTGTNVLDTVVNKVGELGLGNNYVTCTSTSGSGLQATTKTQFKHWYYADVHCNSGRYRSGVNHTTGSGNCLMDYYNNESKCGCKYYYEKRTSACGVESWNSCETSGCGIKSYNTCATSACGSNYKTVTEYKCCPKTGTSGGVKTTTGSCGDGYDICGSSDKSVFNGYKSCANSACGVAHYNTCENSACDVNQYNSCRDSSHGCERGNDCTLTENGYRWYSCHLTATAPGTAGNGTLSGHVCSF